MRPAVALVNLVLGTVYMAYGIMTIIDLRQGWQTMGFSHFGLAWITMAFTCGPHHVEHGLHVAFGGRAGGPLDLLTVVVGLPAGLVWVLLRVEALVGGRGDRFLRGTPGWVKALPWVSAGYPILLAVAAFAVIGGRPEFGPRYTPNVLLLFLYGVIGYYLLRTQLRNRPVLGGWSLSGLALTLVFPTCGLMHAIYVVYAASGRYDVEVHGLVIGWLSVPAAVYFVWVVRRLHLGLSEDWNRGTSDARPADARPAEATPAERRDVVAV